MEGCTLPSISDSGAKKRTVLSFRKIKVKGTVKGCVA